MCQEPTKNQLIFEHTVNPILLGVFGSFITRGGPYLAPPIKNGHNWWGGSKIEFEPHIIPRLMLDKRNYNFQIPRTTPGSGHFLGYLLDIHLCS